MSDHHRTPGSEAESSTTLQVIPAEECYELLAGHEVGRIGVLADGYPVILPVNYVLDGTTIVLRTDSTTILGAAEHANVTFEVDEIDRPSRSGWSVLVRAQAEEVGADHRAELVARTLQADVRPWAPGERGHWVRLIAHDISGRRILPGELPPLDARGYL